MKKRVIAMLIMAALMLFAGSGFSQQKKKTKKTTNTPKGLKTVWLKDLKPIKKDSAVKINLGNLNGKTYSKAMRFEPTVYCTGSGPVTIVYNLAKKYDTFEAYFGVDDNSTEDILATLDIIGDGQTLYTSSKGLSDMPDFINIKISNIVRLEIVITMNLKGECLDPVNVGFIATIGDPKLIIGVKPKETKKEVTSTSSTESTSTTEESESSCDGGSAVIIDPKAMETLANNLAVQVKDAGMTTTGKIQLAVTKFKLVDVCKKSVADNVLEDLSTYLLKTKMFKLIEREQLEKAVKELKFGLTGFIEPKKVIELGKMVGAEAILIGSVSDRGSFVVINARIINTKTGEADIAENVEIKK